MGMRALLCHAAVQLKILKVPLQEARLSGCQWAKTAELVRRVAAAHSHLSANILQTAAANSKLVDGSELRQWAGLLTAQRVWGVL